MVVLPFKYSFIEQEYYEWEAFDTIIDIIFFIDLIFVFITPYMDQNDKLVFSKKKIAIRYLKFWFWIDICSIFPFDRFIDHGAYTIFLRILRIPKVFRVFKITRVVKKSRTIRKQNNLWSYISDRLRLNPGVYRLFINLFYIFLFCHTFACVFHLLGEFNSDDPESWIWRENLVNAPAVDKYLLSLYWVSQTVITVGYGDIGSVGWIEQSVAIFGMLAGVIFFSLTIGSLTSLISDMDQKNTVYESKLNTLIEIKEQFGISPKMFSGIQKVLKYDIFRSDENYNTFLSTLPESIRHEIAYEIYKDDVKNIEFFKLMGNELISVIGPHLQKVIFSKNETIFNVGELAYSIYFISKGEVAYVMPEKYNSLPFLVYESGNYFGEVDLVFSQSRRFKAIAKTEVELLMLSSDDFHQVLSFNFRKVATKIREHAEGRRTKQVEFFEIALRKVESYMDKKKYKELEKTISKVLDDEVFPIILAEVSGSRLRTFLEDLEALCLLCLSILLLFWKKSSFFSFEFCEILEIFLNFLELESHLEN